MKKLLIPENNEVDDINKAGETICALLWVRPTTVVPITDTSSDTPCPPEVERLVSSVGLLQKQQIQILYYLTQVQMTCNNM